jgi:ubiquinone/menaquinone biosynthesis C-methylase UbiE
MNKERKMMQQNDETTASQENNDYILATGERGNDRLTLVQTLYGPVSLDFLTRHFHFSPDKIATILDLGAGNGAMTIPIATIVNEGNNHVTALDKSPAQCRLITKRIKKENILNVTVITGELSDLEPTQKFDLIYCRFLLIHVPNASDLLAQIYQHLKPNGVFICGEYNISQCSSKPINPAFEKTLDWYKILASQILGYPFIIKNYFYCFKHT